MDRKLYGELIVEQIIKDYKNSNEFREDAKDFLNRWINCILNYKIASIGDKFAETINETMVIPDEAKEEFKEGMEKYNRLRSALDELYSMLDDEHNKDLYPYIKN